MVTKRKEARARKRPGRKDSTEYQHLRTAHGILPDLGSLVVLLSFVTQDVGILRIYAEGTGVVTLTGAALFDLVAVSVAGTAVRILMGRYTVQTAHANLHMDAGANQNVAALGLRLAFFVGDKAVLR